METTFYIKNCKKIRLLSHVIKDKQEDDVYQLSIVSEIKNEELPKYA